MGGGGGSLAAGCHVTGPRSKTIPWMQGAWLPSATGESGPAEVRTNRSDGGRSAVSGHQASRNRILSQIGLSKVFRRDQPFWWSLDAVRYRTNRSKRLTYIYSRTVQSWSCRSTTQPVLRPPLWNQKGGGGSQGPELAHLLPFNH